MAMMLDPELNYFAYVCNCKNKIRYSNIVDDDTLTSCNKCKGVLFINNKYTIWATKGSLGETNKKLGRI